MALAQRTLPARGALGCVLVAEGGVYEVWTSRGRERATLDGRLLADIARDRGAMPVAGDWVELTRWHDGRVTLAGRAGPLGCPETMTRRPRLRLVR